MATGCGCARSCDCLVRGKVPVSVEGNGSTQRAYEVGMAYGGETGPQAVTACVAEQLGMGLEYDRGSKRIQAAVSRHPDNALHFDGDGRLLVTGGGGGPSPDACNQVTLETLPEAPGVVGADAMAGLLHPYNSPDGLRYCLNQGFDIIGCVVSSTSDDVAWLAEYTTGEVSTARSTILVDYFARALSSDTLATTRNTAGEPDDPAGGWYGWLARQYDNWFLPQLLREVAGRAVVLAICTVPIPAEGDAPTPVTEQQNVYAATRAVVQACAQQWALVGVRELVSAESVVAAGLHPVMVADYPNADGQPTGSRALGRWGPTGLPWPVADLQAAGVQWLLLDRYYDDTVFTTYQEAGLQVLMYGATRHADRDRVARLGIRGGHALDPLYYRGGAATGQYGYRAQADPWTLRRPGTGQLTHQTDRRLVIHSAGPGGVRGHCEAAEQGLVLPAQFGQGYGRPAVLCGWEAPLVNPQEYYIDFEMKVTDLGDGPASIQKIGMLFGAETDLELFAWPADDPEANPEGFPQVPPLAYRGFQRTTGELGLGKWDRASGEYIRLGDEVDSPALTADVWNRYRVMVNQNGVAFIRWLQDGTPYFVEALDTDYRGGYAFFEKEEGLAGLADSGTHPFEVKVRNVSYNEGAPPQA